MIDPMTGLSTTRHLSSNSSTRPRLYNISTAPYQYRGAAPTNPGSQPHLPIHRGHQTHVRVPRLRQQLRHHRVPQCPLLRNQRHQVRLEGGHHFTAHHRRLPGGHLVVGQQGI